MFPTNLLTLSAMTVAVLGAVLMVLGVLHARKARDGAFYGLRRDARLAANRRFGAALFVLVLAAVLYLFHFAVPDLNLPADPELGTASATPAPTGIAGQPIAAPTVTPASTPTRQPATPTAIASATPAVAATETVLSVETLPTLAPATPLQPGTQRLALRAVASGIDANGMPVDEGTRFAARTKEVYIFFDFQNVPPSALVRHTWFHKSGSVYFRSDALNRNGSGMAALSWAPDGGFEPGLYEVRVLLGNVPQFVANFEIR
jgi:hypothetical protein